MQWGGALNLFDALTNSPMTVRTFGSFEGTIPNPEHATWLQNMILKAVETAAIAHAERGLLGLASKQEQIAQAAQAQIAPQLEQVGAVGQLSIAMFSFSEDDVARMKDVAAKGAAENRAKLMAQMAAASAEPEQAASGACTKCGAAVTGKFCRECGAPHVEPSAAAAAPVAPQMPQAVDAPPPIAAMNPGANVLVQWSDGNRYPAVVHENRGDQILVAFPNGSMNWIPSGYVFAS